jgi:hypothetical protein
MLRQSPAQLPLNVHGIGLDAMILVTCDRDGFAYCLIDGARA